MLRTALLTLALAAPALAQAQSPNPEPVPAAPASIALPPPEAPSLNANGLHEFMAHYLSYDEAHGQAFEGQGRSPVERAHFYEVVGRPDLAGEVHDRQFRRTMLFAGAGAAALVGLGSGAALMLSAPDLDSAACQEKTETFAACADKRATLQLTGRALIAGGLLGAGVLSLLALNVDLDPVPRAESHRLANEYNGSLRRRLTLGASREGAGRALTLAPEAGPGQAGLRLALRY